MTRFGEGLARIMIDFDYARQASSALTMIYVKMQPVQELPSMRSTSTVFRNRAPSLRISKAAVSPPRNMELKGLLLAGMGAS